MPHRLRQYLAFYLILVGLAAHLAPVAGAWWVMRHYQLSPNELVAKTVEKYGDRLPWMAAWFKPAPRYADHRLDGAIRPDGPRILGLGRAGPGSLARRIGAYQSAGITPPRGVEGCGNRQAYAQVVCWLAEGSEKAAGNAIARLEKAEIIARRPHQTVAIKGFGPSWRFAIGYDLMRAHPRLDAARRAHIEDILRAALRLSLARLDGDSASLWHTRSTLGAEAWILAVALGPGRSTDRPLIARAQAHFLAAIDALRLSEAWPEGYNYWINSRAMAFAVAASAYVHGLAGGKRSQEVVEAVRAAAHWNLYALRPDHRIEGLGDEGPRVDQREETRRFVDLVAQLSGDRALSSYSRYLAAQNGAASYYRAYRWAFALLNDPEVQPLPGSETGALAPLARSLPHARLFGRGGLNLAFFRSGWDADATVVGFRAGAAMSHHGHYDAGHFSLFKGGPLAVNSSLYGAIFDENRLHYSIRTIAKNSILLLRPEERVRPNRFFQDNVAGGGQRIVMPTGSAVLSVADFETNREAGRRYGGGRVRAFSHRAGEHSFVSADITAAYDTARFDARGTGGRARRVVRDLLYLHDDDILIVRDDVETTRSDITKKWLLHTLDRPDADGLRVVKGKAGNGILETAHPVLAARSGNGRLVVRRFAPARAIARLVGGPDYRFYVETDGDDATLDGRNMSGGARDRAWFDKAMWRIEIQPMTDALRHHFLIGLTPSLGRARPDALRRIEIDAPGIIVLESRRALIVYLVPGAAAPADAVRLPVRPGQKRLYIIGEPDGTQVTLDARGGRHATRKMSDVLLSFHAPVVRGPTLSLRFTR